MTSLIIGLFIAIIFSGFFSGMEIAFVSSNRLLAEVAREKNGFSQRALDIFYTSKTNERLHDPSTFLYGFSDLYIVDEIIMELQRG